VNELSLNWGIENHMKGSASMSTYWGYDFGIAAISNFDLIGIRAELFSGFDFYNADGLFLRAELGYRPSITIDPFELNMPGADMNASIKMGYRF